MELQPWKSTAVVLKGERMADPTAAELVADRLTRSEVADRLQITERTLTRWVKLGVGPRSYKLGGQRYWLGADVDGWILAEYNRVPVRSKPARPAQRQEGGHDATAA
jgi:predicted DNA-binding transcriptional regulator AlpA